MSAFYLLGVLTLWGWLTWLLWKAGRRFLGFGVGHISLRLVLLAVVALVWLGGSFWECGGKKLYWDMKVREMCKKDGGIRIYETVKLSSDKFNKLGQPNFYRPDQGENALGVNYIFKWDIYYMKNGNPSLQRSCTQVFRRDDNKLLGEAIDYSRGGGDLPGPWQPSAFTCPKNVGHIQLLTKIFLDSGKEM